MYTRAVALAADDTHNVYVVVHDVDDSWAESRFVKLSAGGSQLFDERIPSGTYSADHITDITVAGSALYLTGNYDDDGYIYDNPKPDKAFVAKYTLSGSLNWMRKITGSSRWYLAAISADSSGGLFVTGTVIQDGLNDTDAFLA